MNKKRLRKLGWIGIAVCLSIPTMGCAKEEIEPNDYPVETIIAQAEKLENELVHIRGYAKFEKDGVLLYYTKRDYQYDTKENAIWLPEREDIPLEEYFRNRSVDEDSGECVDGKFYIATGVIQEKEKTSPYAALVLYCRMGDKIWNQANPLPEAIDRYDRANEKKNAQRVSYYRLLGDPWSFDGKKVCVDIKYKQAGELCLNYAEHRSFGIRCAEDIYGNEINYQKPFEEIVNEYKSNGKFKDVEIEELRDIVELPIYTKGIRMEMELMFYMHEVSQYRLNDTAVKYTCWPCRVAINSRDRQKWEKGVEELYQLYREK